MSNSSTNNLKINCPNCDSLQSKSANFCMECGSRLPSAFMNKVSSSNDKSNKPLIKAPSKMNYQSGKTTINSSVLVSIHSRCSDFVCQSGAEFICTKCRAPLCISHALRINRKTYCSRCSGSVPGAVTSYRRNVMGGYNATLPVGEQCKYFCLVFGTFGCITVIVLVIVLVLL